MREKLAAALLAILVPFVATGQTSGNTIRLSGRILSPNGPIRHQQITIQGAGQKELGKVETDEDGRFAFSDLRPDARYSLIIDVKGFYPWSMGIDVRGQDMDLGSIGLSPHRPVDVFGRVVDYTGAAIQQATVELSSGDQQQSATQTDQNGKFYLPPVPPDRQYSVAIVAHGFSPTSMPIAAEDGDVDLGTIVMQPIGPWRAGAPVRRQSRNTVIVSGRITDMHNVPVTERGLNFRMRVPSQPAGPVYSLRPDAGGRFVLPIESQKQYEMYIPERGDQPNYELVARIEAGGGWDVDFGNIAVQPSTHSILGPHSPLDFPLGELGGPVTVAGPTGSMPSSGHLAKIYIAAIFIGADGGVSILQSDGKLVRIPKEKDEVGARFQEFSSDARSVGWLVDSDFCCTSYPIQKMLVIYTPGKPLRRFTGDGRAIFRWSFVAGGKRVAFYQDFLHGTSAPHDELRDVESERLIKTWDGDATPAPAWTRNLRQ